MNEMIGIKDGRTLLKTAAYKLRTQEAEIKDLKSKVAQFEENERIVKIAQDMEEKGFGAEYDFEEKVAHLRERAKAGSGKLDVTEEAVKLAGPQGQFFGGASDDEPGGGSSKDAFTTFIMTGEDTTG